MESRVDLQQPAGDATATAGSRQDSWLTSLQLIAVQPACLRALSETPTHIDGQQPAQQNQQQAGGPQAQQPAQQPQLLQAQQAPPAHLQHHELLLQLQATVKQQHQPVHRQVCALGRQLQVTNVTAGATVDTCSLLPLPVQKAVLQVVLLNRQMQVLLHRQYSFQELLQGQQQDWASTAVAAADAAGASSSSSGSRGTPAADQVLHLNLQLSAPCQPSSQALDALHLFITLCSAQLADPDLVPEPQQQQACLVAELPLLVMPALAHQEVQQLLLPAMRQDLQTEQQGAHEDQQLGAAAIAAHAVQVEQAVWQHFNQLALDILLIMQLSDAVRTQAAHDAAGVASTADDSSLPVSPSAAGSVAAAAAAAAFEDQIQHQQPEQPAAVAPGASLQMATALEKLLQAVNTLLLPLLLPYLTAHGLHNTLQVLLQCLPPQLQLQQHWQQQQLARLHALATQAQQQPPQQPQEQQQDQQQPGLPNAADAAAGAGAVGIGVVVVSSAMLDTPPAPPPGTAGTAAPAAAAEYAESSCSGSVYGSARSCSPPGSGEIEVQGRFLLHATCVSLQLPQGEDSPKSARGDDSGGGSSRQASGCHILQDWQQQQQHGASSSQHAAASSSESSPAAAAAAAVDPFAGSSQQPRLQHRRGGSISAVVAGRSPTGSQTTEQQRGSSSSSRRMSGVYGGAHGPLSAATGMPCWLVPFKQFSDSEVERRYVAYKHRQLLYLDMLGGIYQFAVAGALTKRALYEHPATWILLLMTIIKALPHLPLLLGYRQQHIRCRELWMFLASPIIGLLLCFLVLFTNAWQPSSMPPMPLAYRSFWRMHGELITAALRAFFQHMRLRPFILYTTVDRLVSMQIWAPWSGVLTAVGRSTAAGVVSVVVCWALELCCRRSFVMAGLYQPAEGVGQGQHRLDDDRPHSTSGALL